jgi:alpha-ketoglutarate-dependent taurine dioxygenase
MTLKFDRIKPQVGAIVHVDKSCLKDPSFGPACFNLLEERSVLVFPRINFTPQEQLAFTDAIGPRLNPSAAVPGGDHAAKDVYTVTLDADVNSEPEYVYGTWFWHMDGMTQDIARTKATVLQAKRVAPKGGETEFASTYAAYEALPEAEKKELEGLRVIHSVVASVREVITPEELNPVRRAYTHEHPLVYTHPSGRKSLLIGYTADYIVGMPRQEGRSRLVRLMEWAAQPAFTYSHKWQEGDLVIWDNCSALHRVNPYDKTSGRSMHRTSIAISQAA